MENKDIAHKSNSLSFRGSTMASSSSSSAASSYSNSPCAACKFLRRKCLPGCIFAPYFPPEEPQKFANVHKIFGASNVSKLLNEIQPHQREDAVNSLAYEAEARLKDPVYGCVGAISVLQRQVLRLQKELDATNADLMRYASHHESYPPPPPPPPNISVNQILINQQQRTNPSQYGRLIGHHQNYDHHHHHHHAPYPSYTSSSSSWNNNINSFSGDDPVDK